MQNIKTIPQLAVQNLPADLESKADADEVVLLTGNQTVEGNKNLTETPVIQLWNADINPTANQTIVFSINSLGTFELYKNKTGNNGSNPPAQDGTNWEFISTCQGSRAYVQEFAASESPVSSVTLTEGVCYNADFMTVAVDHTILDPSAYTLGINGTTITFDEPVQAGLTITVRWFTQMNLSNVYRQPLLTCFWSDHLIYELSYLCADPFSWQDGNVYSAVYSHLVADIDGKSTTTEGSITYYLADDGHKIATAASHDAVADLYDETGVAWFYILDTTNHRFKLPRTKYAFNGWRGDVGDYIPESLPNITGSARLDNGVIGTYFDGTTGAFYKGSAWTQSGQKGSTGNANVLYYSGFDASRSSSTYQNGAPVQQRGTQMYLYFYVGNYTPQAVEQTAGYAQTLTELKADKDLANSPYTTNRILEIPQDIKLELNNGTLTLKAGSKVYVPNGFESDGVTPKFDTIIVDSNKTLRDTQPYYYRYIMVYDELKNFYGYWENIVVSGPTQPTGYTYCIWYDTTNNICKVTSDSFSTYKKCSLPIGIYQQSSSGVTAYIDQVFNGFGYIGSTVFALPGVKVQIPNGRNEDGTCKSLITNITSVKTLTVNASWGTYDIFIVSSGGIGRWPDIVSGSAGTRYNAATNYYEVMSEGKWISQLDCVFVKIKTDTTSPYKITSFEPYIVDSVANSNASNFSQAGRSYLSGLGMPSDTGYLVSNSFATSTNFIAPSNGYFRFRAAPKTANATFMVFLGNIGNKLYSGGFYNGLNTGQAVNCFLPVKQGQSVSAQHSNANLTFDAGSGLWFIPDEGEN